MLVARCLFMFDIRNEWMVTIRWICWHSCDTNPNFIATGRIILANYPKRKIVSFYRRWNSHQQLIDSVLPSQKVLNRIQLAHGVPLSCQWAKTEWHRIESKSKSSSHLDASCFATTSALPTEMNGRRKTFRWIASHKIKLRDTLHNFVYKRKLSFHLHYCYCFTKHEREKKSFCCLFPSPPAQFILFSRLHFILYLCMSVTVDKFPFVNSVPVRLAFVVLLLLLLSLLTLCFLLQSSRGTSNSPVVSSRARFHTEQIWKRKDGRKRNIFNGRILSLLCHIRNECCKSNDEWQSGNKKQHKNESKIKMNKAIWLDSGSPAVSGVR